MSDIRNAIITEARLSTDDRGFLDAWIMLDYGGMCQGFGGYCLYLPKSFKHHELKSVAGHFIFRSMEVARAERWDKMVGKAVRVRRDEFGIEAIGHIVKDDWFCPREDFK